MGTTRNVVCAPKDKIQSPEIDQGHHKVVFSLEMNQKNLQKDSFKHPTAQVYERIDICQLKHNRMQHLVSPPVAARKRKE